MWEHTRTPVVQVGCSHIARGIFMDVLCCIILHIVCCFSTYIQAILPTQERCVFTRELKNVHVTGVTLTHKAVTHRKRNTYFIYGVLLGMYYTMGPCQYNSNVRSSDVFIPVSWDFSFYMCILIGKVYHTCKQHVDRFTYVYVPIVCSS